MHTLIFPQRIFIRSFLNPFSNLKSKSMDSENLFSFESLVVYKKAIEYIDYVYLLTNRFPTSEKFGMSSQWRRAASSIALNTGEGAGSSDADFINFLGIAKRSIRECVVTTTISYRQNYISKESFNESRSKLVELSKLNSGLVNSIKRKMK